MKTFKEFLLMLETEGGAIRAEVGFKKYDNAEAEKVFAYKDLDSVFATYATEDTGFKPATNTDHLLIPVDPKNAANKDSILNLKMIKDTKLAAQAITKFLADNKKVKALIGGRPAFFIAPQILSPLSNKEIVFKVS